MRHYHHECEDFPPEFDDHVMHPRHHAPQPRGRSHAPQPHCRSHAPPPHGLTREGAVRAREVHARLTDCEKKNEKKLRFLNLNPILTMKLSSKNQ